MDKREQLTRVQAKQSQVWNMYDAARVEKENLANRGDYGQYRGAFLRMKRLHGAYWALRYTARRLILELHGR